jgi:hypothetical protein
LKAASIAVNLALIRVHCRHVNDGSMAAMNFNIPARGDRDLRQLHAMSTALRAMAAQDGSSVAVRVREARRMVQACVGPFLADPLRFDQAFARPSRARPGL